MWHNLSALFNKLSTDSNVRAIIFSGAGRAFTAGLDVQAASGGGTFAPPTVDSARKANGETVKQPTISIPKLTASRTPKAHPRISRLHHKPGEMREACHLRYARHILRPGTRHVTSL